MSVYRPNLAEVNILLGEPDAYCGPDRPSVFYDDLERELADLEFRAGYIQAEYDIRNGTSTVKIIYHGDKIRGPVGLFFFHLRLRLASFLKGARA